MPTLDPDRLVNAVRGNRAIATGNSWLRLRNGLKEDTQNNWTGIGVLRTLEMLADPSDDSAEYSDESTPIQSQKRPQEVFESTSGDLAGTTARESMAGSYQSLENATPRKRKTKTRKTPLEEDEELRQDHAVRSAKRRRQYISSLLYSDTGKQVSTSDALVNLEASPLCKYMLETPSVSFGELFTDVLASIRVEEAEKARSLSIPKTYELFNNPFYHQVVGKGDECLSELRRTVDEFGLKRHSNQVHFHEQMFRACLAKIYQYDFEQNIDRVLRENGWDRVVQEVMVITARRIGKCLAGDTEILLANGNISRAQELRPGDLVMGDDGSPRLVAFTSEGKGPMYQVKADGPATGIPDFCTELGYTIPYDKGYVCNDEHLIVVADRVSGKETTIQAAELEKAYAREPERVPFGVTREYESQTEPRRFEEILLRVCALANQPYSTAFVQDTAYYLGAWYGTRIHSPSGISAICKGIPSTGTTIESMASARTPGQDWADFVTHKARSELQTLLLDGFEHTNSRASVIEFSRFYAHRIGCLLQLREHGKVCRLAHQNEQRLERYSTANFLAMLRAELLYEALGVYDPDFSRKGVVSILPRLFQGFSKQVRLRFMAGVLDASNTSCYGHRCTQEGNPYVHAAIEGSTQVRDCALLPIRNLARSTGFSAHVWLSDDPDDSLTCALTIGTGTSPLALLPSRTFADSFAKCHIPDHRAMLTVIRVQKRGIGKYYGVTLAVSSSNKLNKTTFDYARAMKGAVSPELSQRYVLSLIASGKLSVSVGGRGVFLQNGKTPFTRGNPDPGKFLHADCTVTHNTTAVAMLVAALLLCVPKIEIMIFSVSLNSSRKMLQMVKDMLAVHPKYKKAAIEINSKDKFWFKMGENDRRMCESRPGRGNVSYQSKLYRSCVFVCGREVCRQDT